MRVEHSSVRMDYETPPYIFDPLMREFDFTLDLAAVPATAKCAHYFTPEVDALRVAWSTKTHPERCWMNPPYGRGPKQLPGFIDKAIEQVNIKCTTPLVVALVPARTDTVWFKNAWHYADEIRFYTGRIRFVGMDNGAPFPSCLIVFRPTRRKAYPIPRLVEVSP